MLFMKFCIFWRLKTKLTKSRTLKKAKISVWEFQDSPKLISHKVWVIWKSWNFHTVLKAKCGNLKFFLHLHFRLKIKNEIIFSLYFRFSVGMGFSIVYGALLTKTNRISRIFHSASQSARRPSYISPKSQLIITAVLVSVQFLATLVWIVAAFPNAQKVYPQRSEVRQFFSFTQCTMLQKLSKCEVKAWLCWNLIIFPALKLCLKSNIGKFRWSKNVIFGNFRDSEIWILVNLAIEKCSNWLKSKIQNP